MTELTLATMAELLFAPVGPGEAPRVAIGGFVGAFADLDEPAPPGTLRWWSDGREEVVLARLGWVVRRGTVLFSQGPIVLTQLPEFYDPLVLWAVKADGGACGMIWSGRAGWQPTWNLEAANVRVSRQDVLRRLEFTARRISVEDALPTGGEKS